MSYSFLEPQVITIEAIVLGPHNKQFKMVFKEAQLQLRWIFGMEMTELPLKEKVTISQRRGESIMAVTNNSMNN